MPHVQQPPDAFPAVIAVVEGTLVDVHADEFVGKLRVEIAGELHGIGQRFFAMIDGVLNTVAQSLRHTGDRLRTEGATDRIPAQRQWQTGYFLPPLTQIDNSL